MKVTVIGSYKEELFIRNKNARLKKDADKIKEITDLQKDEVKKNKEYQNNLVLFKEACNAIGAALAEGNHRLILAHLDDEQAAERPTLEGFQTYHSSRYKYKTCPVHHGDPDLKAHLDAVEMSDVVILIGGANATFASGISALRRRRVIIPIPAFGGSAKDLCEIREVDDVVPDEIRNLKIPETDGATPNSASDDWKKTLTTSVIKVLNQYPRVLIIHGRGDSGEELKRWIVNCANVDCSNSVCPKVYGTNDQSKDNKSEKNQPDPLALTESNKLIESNKQKYCHKLNGLAEPLIMNLTGSGAVTVPHVFEELASKVSAAIVIVTADDIGGYAKDDENNVVPATNLKLQIRARENVWVEVGWFWGRLGREKIFLWIKDTDKDKKVKIPSDLQGVAITDADKIKNAWLSIYSFLEKMRMSD